MNGTRASRCTYEAPAEVCCRGRHLVVVFTMHVLFDLDGTLTDSREGIIACFQHALAELGWPVPPASELMSCLGPPLAGCFASLLHTDDPGTIERAVASYRARYEHRGIYENRVFPGIVEALTGLSRAGHQLYVVTAKPSAYAGRILAHFRLDAFFRGVYGPDLAARRFHKGSLVQAALSENGLTAESAVMIGDRADDINAARQNSIRSLGVTWGYGSREELEAAGAHALVDTPAELADHIVTEPR